MGVHNKSMHCTLSFLMCILISIINAEFSMLGVKCVDCVGVSMLPSVEVHVCGAEQRAKGLSEVENLG